MEDSVAAKSKLPTKMFFISSSVFQSCALDSADLDVGQVLAGLSKGSFSIAAHCSTGQAAPCAELSTLTRVGAPPPFSPVRRIPPLPAPAPDALSSPYARHAPIGWIQPAGARPCADSRAPASSRRTQASRNRVAVLIFISPRRPKSFRDSTCPRDLPLPGLPCSRRLSRTGGWGSAPSNCSHRRNSTSRPSPCP
jgi:hypothetical protein